MPGLIYAKIGNNGFTNVQEQVGLRIATIKLFRVSLVSLAFGSAPENFTVDF